MKKRLISVIAALLCVCFAGCGPSYPDVYMDTASTTDTATETETGSNEDTDTDTETDSNEDTDSETETDSDEDTDSDGSHSADGLPWL